MRSHHRLRQGRSGTGDCRKLCRSRWLRQQYGPHDDTQQRRHEHRRHRSPARGRSTQRARADPQGRSLRRRPGTPARPPRSTWRRCARHRLPAQVPPDLAARAAPSPGNLCDRYAKDYKGYLRDAARGAGLRSDCARAGVSRSRSTSSSARGGSICRSRATTISPNCRTSSSTNASSSRGSTRSRPRPTPSGRSCSRSCAAPGAFSPYVTGHANRPRKDEQGMLNNPDWSAFYLVEERRARPRRTSSAARASCVRCAMRRSQPSEPVAVRPVLAAEAGHAHPAPQRAGQHPADLPPAVDRAGQLPAARRQRDPGMGDGQGLGLRRHRSITRPGTTATRRASSCCSTSGGPNCRPTERTLVTQLFEAIDAYNGTKPDWEI